MSEPLRIHPVFAASPFEGVIHGYSTRGGGISLPPYESLNLGDHVGDDPLAIQENRLRLSQTLGVPPDRWVTAEQVHGGEVARVNEADAGRKIPGVDALITDTPQLPLALFYADCASLFFYDPRQHAIGMAHAGWRGTAAAIAAHTVRAMESEFGSRPEDLHVGLGPHIGACCYAVGEEVAQAFHQWPGAIITDGETYRADLGVANRAQLLECGVNPDRITAASPCTACQSDLLFSYRRDGPTGRMAALLMLKDE